MNEVTYYILSTRVSIRSHFIGSPTGLGSWSKMGIFALCDRIKDHTLCPGREWYSIMIAEGVDCDKTSNRELIIEPEQLWTYIGPYWPIIGHSNTGPHGEGSVRAALSKEFYLCHSLSRGEAKV